jgi:hypothetical protein
MSNEENKKDVNNSELQLETDGLENNKTAAANEIKLDKEAREEYLSRFHSYEEKTIRNERIATGSRAENAHKKNKNKKKTSAVIRTIILIISAAAFIISGAVIAKRGIDFAKTKNLDTKLDDLTIPDDEFSFPSTSNEYLEALIEKYPHLKDVEFPTGFNYKYALLYAANRDFVGYLTIPGTRINTAVLQHSDDIYYYDHDFYGKISKYGSIFAPVHNNMIYLDLNTALMGHHMKDG